MRIYGISGLGADERVFDQVNEYLKEPITYVPWIDPEPEESLRHYAHRLAKTINTDEPFSLIGLSFGGMLASEMNKVIKPERTLIISSAASKDELPRFFRGVGKLNLVPNIPKRLIQFPDAILDTFMSVKKPENRELVHQIMKDTDLDFLKWATQSILTWDNEEVPRNLKRIHGNSDLVLPLKTEADDLMEGGHMVIIEEPEQMAKLIEKELKPA